MFHHEQPGGYRQRHSGAGSTDRVIATVPVGGNPFGAGVDPGTGRVFVANRNSGDVSVFEDSASP